MGSGSSMGKGDVREELAVGGAVGGGWEERNRRASREGRRFGTCCVK